jgi:hypothetical protein
MKKVATIVLNRNLPEATDHLVEHILKYDGDNTDVFVVEAGSTDDKLSKYCTWHAKTDEICKMGLRYGRGMNYALTKLWESEEFLNYSAFFLLTNDTELEDKSTIKPLLEILEQQPEVGILSPCSQRWGEKYLLKENETKYFWFIHNNAYFLRREFIEDICEKKNPSYMNFLFDGTNFRGYLLEEELIAKAYANNWAAAITSCVWVEENESYLLNHADVIKTESYEDNFSLYISEGLEWVKRKYGFNSHWVMQQYVKQFYDSFFVYYPEYEKYRIE